MESDDHLPETAFAARLKALRLGRGLTLDALAAASGVSRAMISRIERAEVSPTAALLGRLCSALGLTLSAFFAAGETGSPLVRRDAQTLWRDPDTGYLRRSVSPPGMPSRVDIVEVEFPPGARILFPPQDSSAGMTQHVWLFAGELQMTVGETVHHLHAGDCLYMSIAGTHGFHNPGTVAAHYAVVLDRGGAAAASREKR